MNAARGTSPREALSWFVRPVPRHPGRFVPPRSEPEGQPELDESALARQMPAEPAMFVVGLDSFAEVEDHARRAGLPPLSADRFEHAPFDIERYLGRVEEVSESGQVIATLWEVPSGRHGTACFEPSTTFEPEPPRVGALLHVWAWSELSATGSVETKKLLRVENRTLTEEERARLRALLDTEEDDSR